MGEVEVIIIDEVQACADAVEEWMQLPAIAVDLEGMDIGPGGEFVPLGRDSDIYTVQVAHGSSRAWVLDILSMGSAAFDSGRLRELLQSESVTKVFFDARRDADALFHRFNVTLQRVYDLQVLHALVSDYNIDRSPQSLSVCLRESGLVEPATLKKLEIDQKKVKGLFRPSGVRQWRQRPLHPDSLIVQYSVDDVKYSLKVATHWSTADRDRLVFQKSQRRIERYVYGPQGQRVRADAGPGGPGPGASRAPRREGGAQLRDPAPKAPRVPWFVLAAVLILIAANTLNRDMPLEVLTTHRAK